MISSNSFAFKTGLVHDRRIDGQIHVFGNAGGLMLNAMTWWDHETESIWSQPWSRSIDGPYKGTELFLLPPQITTWASWKAEYPNTLAMINDYQRVGFTQKFDPDFVIGLILVDDVMDYYYRDVEAAEVVNDFVGTVSVMVTASDENFHAYIRQVGDQILTFRLEGDKLVDDETGSTWNITSGLATGWPLERRGSTKRSRLQLLRPGLGRLLPRAGFYQQ